MGKTMNEGRGGKNEGENEGKIFYKKRMEENN